MAEYVQPLAEILLFLPRQAVAREDRRAEDGNEEIEIPSSPEVSEGVGDW